MTGVSGHVGTVVSLHRYPVKSMGGEVLEACAVAATGVLGDRAFALVDAADGKVASAKNPRKWRRLLDCRAEFVRAPEAGAALPAVRIVLPDGAAVVSDEADVHERLSQALGRAVRLVRADRRDEDVRAVAGAGPWSPRYEEYWPEEVAGRENRGAVTEEAMLAETFVDDAPVHVLTTATLERLHALYPGGNFDARRFRPNVVVEAAAGEGFVENGWLGRAARIGEEAVLEITEPMERCVMTTLPQGDLAKDPGILRAAVRHNDAGAGVCASVRRGGRLARGAPVRVD